MWLLVGLGNPGAKYELTRHNIGFLAIDAISDLCEGANFQSAFSGELASTFLKNEKILLLKPQTFMNKSGNSVSPASSYFKIKPENVLVIHDDLDLPLGTVRLKKGGGHGGHNGLRDIIQHIGPDFHRLRLGIGRPPGQEVAHSYVLGLFSKEQDAALNESLVDACRAAESMIFEGLEKTQMTFHTKK